MSRRPTRDYSTTSSSSYSTSSFSESEEDLRLGEPLGDYASTISAQQLSHEKNSLAGISLEALLGATTPNLAPLQTALPLMGDHMPQFESQRRPLGTLVNTNSGITTTTTAKPLSQPRTDGLVHVSTLSPSQLAAVQKKTAEWHQSAFSPRSASCRSTSRRSCASAS